MPSFQIPGGALEQSNKHTQIEVFDCSLFVSDWVDSLIGPSSGLLLVSLPPTCTPSFSFTGGVGKKLATKTWMLEIFLQGHVLSVGEDAVNNSTLTYPVAMAAMYVCMAGFDCSY